MSILVLFGGDGPEQAMRWVLTGADGAAESRGDGPAPAAKRAVLVLPAAEARLTPAALPARTEAQARAGAAYLFEGELAVEGEMHFAVGAPFDAEGNRLVAAISTARLRAWLERCAAIGSDPAFVTLDCALWPVAAGEIAVVEAGGRTIVAAGDAGGFSIESSMAPAVFARWRGGARVEGRRTALFGGDAAAWTGATGGSIDAQGAADVEAVLAQAAADPPATAPNLRQGAFATAERARPPLKVWRFAATLAAAAVLLQIGSQVVDGVRDRQTAARLLASAEREFREMAPAETRVVNLRTQVASMINAMEQSSRHPVLSAAAPMIAALRQQPLARIDEVRHLAPSRKVAIVVSAPDRAALEGVAGVLRAAAVTVDTHDLPPQGGRYAVELSVEAPL